LLNHDARIHFTRKADWTAILAAAENGQVEVSSELFKHCAFVDTATKKSSKLLKVTAKNGLVDIIRDLLKLAFFGLLFILIHQ
jgi:hypothetical protein